MGRSETVKRERQRGGGRKRSTGSGSATPRRRNGSTAGAAPADSAGRGDRVRIRRFDADRRDESLTWDQLFEALPTERQLLWIDITGNLGEAEAKRLAQHFELAPRTRAALQTHSPEPLIALHRGYLHVRVAAEPSDKDPGDAAWLDVMAGTNVTITQHREPIGFLGDVDDRIERDTDLGILSAPAFFAAILDEAITSYHRAVDAVEEDVDDVDAQALRGNGERELLRHLVRLRRRIARLRRLLADHRAVFAALSSPEVASFVGDPETAAVFASVSARFDGAIGAVEDSREALIGSFDVFMSQTAQRTNDVMKVLTLATVLLLPGSLIAGLLGMNVVVPLSKDDPTSFWMVLVAIVVMALAIVWIARSRKWL